MTIVALDRTNNRGTTLQTQKQHFLQKEERTQDKRTNWRYLWSVGAAFDSCHQLLPQLSSSFRGFNSNAVGNEKCPRRKTMKIWCVDYFVDLLTIKSYESKRLGILPVVVCLLCCVKLWEIVIGKKRVVEREALWILLSEFLVVHSEMNSSLVSSPIRISCCL